MCKSNRTSNEISGNDHKSKSKRMFKSVKTAAGKLTFDVEFKYCKRSTAHKRTYGLLPFVCYLALLTDSKKT